MVGDLSSGPARFRLTFPPLLAGLLLAWLISPSPARAACPVPDPTYFDSCGPTFTLPAWGDAAGWDDPSKYSTIQLADVNGDGKDELLGRGDAGLEIWTFDTSVGQWRPQVDANAVRQVLTDFRSPLPSEDRLGWKRPQYYSTIQTANLDGRPGVEVIARFRDGMRAYGYSPPAGGNSIDGGTWRTLATGGPFPDGEGDGPEWEDPQYYLTIKSVGGDRSYLIAHESGGMIAYRWAGGGWQKDSETGSLQGCSDPACYTSLRVTAGSPGLYAANPASSLGHAVYPFMGPGRGWQPLVPHSYDAFPSGPLSNRRGSPDCPLSGDLCFPQIAALYETTRLVSLPNSGPLFVQVTALGPQGLLVYLPVPDVVGGVAWETLPTLSELAYPSSQWRSDPGKAASLMAADIDGQRGDEILALQDGALQAWSYDPIGRAWTRLQPSRPLALSDTSVWNKDASHYATFRAGDVDGDGREDVIARGPFGVRTWFWNRRGTGGWERYLPQGYPAFSGSQSAAFTTLTGLAKAGHVIGQEASSVRDVWTGENPPAASDLTNLQQGVLSIADCSNPLPGEPPRYQTCTVPSGASFSAADWTAVINEVLAEIFAAGQVNTHFSQLDTMRQRAFIAQDAEFPAIGSDLGLQVAANTQVTYDQGSFWDTLFQIVGGLAGLVEPEVGEGLSIAGDLLGMVPSATPSATSKYNTTYAGVQDQFANSISDADKAQAVLSQTVRQDYGLLALVARLREQGTWRPDLIGVASAANQAFAAWVYQSLLPAVYQRYVIQNCYPKQPNDWWDVRCNPPTSSSTFPGVIGFPSSGFFTMLGPPAQDGSPCRMDDPPTCNYTTLPPALANLVFGSVSPQCDYRPGDSTTAWTFGCNLGLSAEAIVDNNDWNFVTCTGSPTVFADKDCGSASVATKRHALGARHNVRLTGVLRVPRGLAFRRVRAIATRVLFEPGGRNELSGPPQMPASRARGTIRSGRTAGRPRARVALRRLGPRRLGFAIRTRRSGLRVPRACSALPRSVRPRTPIVELETRLRLIGRRRSGRYVIRGTLPADATVSATSADCASYPAASGTGSGRGFAACCGFRAWSGPAARRSPGSSCATRGAGREARRSGTSMWRPRASIRDAAPARQCGRPFGGYALAGQRACSCASACHARSGAGSVSKR